jgi:8-oxo-dGTP diphosphatase
MANDTHATFELATKALLRDGERLLVLFHENGKVDFPGGRLNADEVTTPLVDALRREVSEELGDQVSFEIGETCFVSRRSYERDGSRQYIAAIFYECSYLSGEVIISDEHRGYNWLTEDELREPGRTFVSDDEREQLFAYLASHS